MTMKKNKKPKVKYAPDDGRTVYSMASLEGKTPEDLDKREEERKNRISVTRRERRAMIKAAFQVYGPILLIIIVGFSIAALIVYLLLR